MLTPVVVLALDLSLTAPGMVAVPLDWGGDWSRIQRATFTPKLPKEATEGERIERLRYISKNIVAFALMHCCTTAIVEQYAMRPMSQMGHSFHLGELGGVVKLDLTRSVGIPIEVTSPARARKLILGKLPRKDVKLATRFALTSMGLPPAWTEDEADAFVLANWKLSELGGHALIVPQQETEKRSKRRAA